MGTALSVQDKSRKILVEMARNLFDNILMDKLLKDIVFYPYKDITSIAFYAFYKNIKIIAVRDDLRNNSGEALISCIINKKSNNIVWLINNRKDDHWSRACEIFE